MERLKSNESCTSITQVDESFLDARLVQSIVFTFILTAFFCGLIATALNLYISTKNVYAVGRRLLMQFLAVSNQLTVVPLYSSIHHTILRNWILFDWLCPLANYFLLVFYLTTVWTICILSYHALQQAKRTPVITSNMSAMIAISLIIFFSLIVSIPLLLVTSVAESDVCEQFCGEHWNPSAAVFQRVYGSTVFVLHCLAPCVFTLIMLYRTRATLEQQKQTILANFKWTKKTRYQMHINKASRNLFFQGLSLILTTLPNEIVNILHDYKLYKIPSEIVRALYLSTMCFYLLTPVVHLYLNTSSRRFRKQLYLLSLRIPFVRSIAQKLRKQQKAEEQEMMIQTPRNPNTPTVPVPSRFTVQAEIETTL